MRISLAWVMLVALAGCGASNAAPQPKAFDLEGPWLYLGPSDVPHTLSIDHASMAYADVDGHWSSNWTITAFDNGLRHFQVSFDSGSGSYLPVGESKSGAYEMNGALLTVQLANGLASYPPLLGAGTCTSATDGTPLPECRLYIKKN